MLSPFSTQILTCISIMLIAFCGLKIIELKISWLVGKCKYNAKSSIFHTQMLKGLGIIYPISILPFFYFYQDIFNITDYLMLSSLAILGLLDDKYDLNYKTKIIIFLLISFFYNFYSIPLYFYNDLIIGNFILKIFYFVFLIVFFNQIDGINGLAVLTFLVSYFFISFLGGILIMYLPLIFFSIPYLIFNLKGKVGFQGDSGSYFLAGIIYIIILKSSIKLDYLVTIFFLSPILIDLIATTLIKVFLKKNIFEGHRDNIYQKLASQKKNHLISTFLFIFFQIIKSFIVVYLYLKYDLISCSLYLSFISLTILIFFLIISLKIHKKQIFEIKQ